MKVLIPPVYERIVEGADPFANDDFGRKAFSENLTRLFRASDQGLVVTINSPWGGGKTSLVKMWNRALEKDSGFVPIYYDAFKNDFTGDAFISIAVAIEKAMESVVGDHARGKQQLAHLGKSAKELGKGILKRVVTTGLSQISGGVIDRDLSEDIVDKIFFNTLNMQVNQKFKAHHEAMEDIVKYQKALMDITENSEYGKIKIVFFIDELDRCRPSFAIEIIEKVKHLFSTENVFFILSVNRNQIIKTISSAYGVDEKDSETYLQKFVHLEWTLPPLTEIDTESGNGLTKKFIRNMWSLHEIEYTLKDLVVDDIIDLLKSRDFAITPRDIERIFTLVAIVHAVTQEEINERFCLLSVFAATMKVKDSDRFSRGLQGSIHETITTSNQKFNLVKWICKRDYVVKEKTASNSVNIDGLAAICEIIAMYNLPNEEVF